MTTPADQTVVFAFCSLPTVEPAARWTARLSFPPGASAETVLDVEVTDAAGAAVPGGELRLAGRRLTVSKGRASIVYADFVHGKHEPSVWLSRPDRPMAPGTITFL